MVTVVVDDSPLLFVTDWLNLAQDVEYRDGRVQRKETFDGVAFFGVKRSFWFLYLESEPLDGYSMWVGYREKVRNACCWTTAGSKTEYPKLFEALRCV